MKNTFKYIIGMLALVSTMFISSCNEDELIQERLDDNPLPTPTVITPGTADFTKYVSLGNSLTAGFMDGALFPLGQRDTYASMLGTQFAQAGGGTFVFPNTVTGNGFGGVNPDGSFRGRSSANAAAAADPNAALSDIIEFSDGSAITPSSIPSASLNNFAVPGMRIVDATFGGYGALNPYFGGFQSSATASVVGDAAAAGATFFSVWLGSNDVLGYALAGGAFGEDFDPTNSSTLTSTDAFTAALSGILDAMSANGAEGLVLTIPPVTLTPFFQFVTGTEAGINLIPLDAATAGAVNAGYSDYNDGLDAAVLLSIITTEEATRRKVNFIEGANRPVITDETLTVADISLAFGLPAGSVILPNTRHMEPGELLPLTAASVLGVPADPANPTSIQGVAVPLADQFVLTTAEQGAIILRTAQFNGIIAAQAAARPNVNLVDIQPLFSDMFGLTTTQAALLGLSDAAQAAADGVPGLVSNGVTFVPLSLDLNAVFTSLFSTDLIHPNPRGQAFVANEIIRVLNSTYESNFEEVDPLNFPGINVAL
ncbi:MAG: hypothetical protein AAFQ94_01115 [Bacteroidota bacterium]